MNSVYTLVFGLYKIDFARSVDFINDIRVRVGEQGVIEM